MERAGDADWEVVYIDSDEQTQESVAACLTEYSVQTAATAEAGIEQVLDGKIDCVVTAHTLPDGTGFDVLQACKAARPNIPVIFYTANGSETLASEAVANGADGYIPKRDEADCETLVERIRDAIARRTLEPTALDRMSDAFTVLDEDWRLTYLNEQADAIIRRAMAPEHTEALDGLRGERLWDVVPEATDTIVYEKYHEAMETQEPVKFEVYYEPLATWFEVRAHPSETGLSIYFSDITNQKKDKEELQRREAVLTQMYRVVSDKELTFEQKVDELLTIGRDEVNAEYGSLSRIDGRDYTFEVVQSSPGNDSVSAGDKVPLSWTSCERAVTTEETLVIADMDDEPTLTERGGNTELGIRCYLGAPVIIDDEVTGTFCFYDNEPREDSFSQWQITLVELMGNWVSYERERKRRRDELTRERNRMEEFASMVSHDLRSPLNVATARLELVGDECESEHLDDAQEALDRMEELIDDVLALARLGKQVVDTERIEFETVVHEAWGTTSNSTADLVVEDGIETIVADPSRLRQLFENLFRNALDHAGGDVTVRVGSLDSAGFYVEDDGPGIPEDERENVFESGYTTDRDGTGFGLNIVTQIVEAHGGEIALSESETGGARFEITGVETR